MSLCILSFKKHFNAHILTELSDTMGMKEWPGKPSNPKLEDYIAQGKTKYYRPFTDDVPWCAAYVSSVLERVFNQLKMAEKSARSFASRAYATYGEAVEFKDVVPGDLVVFYRKGRESKLGHVAFVIHKTSQYIWVAGGNQSDSVCISKRSTASTASKGVLGYRRPPSVATPTKVQVKRLKKQASMLLDVQGFTEVTSWV